MNLPFQLPPLAAHSIPPIWDGAGFVVEGQRHPVLEYSENFAGWSDDLTTLHEESAGTSHPVDLASRRDAIAQIEKIAPGGARVIMEIGCSSGYLLKDLVKTFPHSLIIGGDVVKQPLYRLASEMPGIPLIRFDLLQCPLPEASVDVLVMLNVLEHINDDVLALKNAFKLLKPGGHLIVEVPAGRALYDAYDAELHHFRRYSAAELAGKLHGAGFAIKRKSHLGFVLYPAFAMTKLLNKWRSSTSERTVVSAQASATSKSRLIDFAMNFESRYLSSLPLPFGIRVLAVASR